MATRGGDEYLEELEENFSKTLEKLKGELSIIRGNRPSVELVENVKVNVYDQAMTVQELGSISIQPPRDILISVWDKNVVGPVVKAIETAKIGLTVSNDGNLIRASLPALTDERRDEFTKLVKKTSENFRIQVRAKRDEVIREVKKAGDNGELNEDQVFKAKEKIQEKVEAVNEEIEEMVEKKLKELNE